MGLTPEVVGKVSGARFALDGFSAVGGTASSLLLENAKGAPLAPKAPTAAAKGKEKAVDAILGFSETFLDSLFRR